MSKTKRPASAIPAARPQRAVHTSVPETLTVPQQPDLRQLFLVSFIEGGVVMVTELAGAKILSPFFGASLYSWAATLSITLLALMAGYYCGGHATTKPKFRSVNAILWIFLLSGIMVLLMPFTAYMMMRMTLSMPFFAGLISSELFFLFPPIFLMGMISPMIIALITREASSSGRSAGNIYAISTCGGILFTLIFGFAVIPGFGITGPLRILGMAVAAVALILLVRHRLSRNNTYITAGVILFGALLSFSQTKAKLFPKPEQMTLQESSEGLLGELEVVDKTMRSPEGRPFQARQLTTSNVQQDYVFVDSLQYSLMYYVNFTDQLLRFIPNKDSAVIVGLGTGSLYDVLRNQNVYPQTVEIDQRIYDYGVKYFGMPAHDNHYITDGRYFLNTTKSKYNLILLDVIIGENVPGQLISKESFQRCYQLLQDDGTMIIEHGAIHNFSDNSFIPSVVKSLQAAGFQVRIFNPVLKQNMGDLLLVCKKHATFDPAGKMITKNIMLQGGPMTNYEVPLSTFDTANATVLTDDINNADLQLKDHYFLVRENIRKELAEGRL
jgi:predicted membrane-bound spermidine synthase